MNVLFVTGHPAQVHNLKYLRSDLLTNGHQVYWLASDKDISKYLLDCYNINYTLLKKPGKSIVSKLFTLIQNTYFVMKFIRRNKIDIACSRVSPYVSLACFFLRVPHIALTDTETAGIYDKLFGQLVSVLFTAKSFKRTLRSDQIRFDGNIELFYLHPNRFTPSNNVHRLLGIEQGTPYVVMRFVSWDAYHDRGLNGFSDENKIKAAKEFSKYAKVFITSEMELPACLKEYRINIPPERMHDVLAGATLFFGESATMASESVVLGTFAIFLNENWFGSTDDAMNYNIMFCYKQSISEQIKAIDKGFEILRMPDTKKFSKKYRDHFIESKIDVTSLFLWFIENYPASYRIMKKNPDYQYTYLK